MSQDNKKDVRALHNLLDFTADADLKNEDARAELEADGVDVNAAVRAALEFVGTKRKEARAQMRAEVLQQAGGPKPARAKRDRSKVSLGELRREAQVRELSPSFRNFDSMSEDDLRSLLEDADDLEESDDAT